ncbi:unnamed protein product [Caenorhabditis angaria]|uniref:Major facilitator superfamily (MFS) profile domain-containing protein n=1 Tax=Caenorhabditis angaria TaxID=860376 RepID=A0A9P1N018_9PELO|nr:unnamed protein product [Caenorhabditis angaria]
MVAECFGINRYIIMILGLLVLSLNYSCFIAYNATFVSMVSSKEVNNSNSPLSSYRFNFTPFQKGVGFAAPFIGAMIAVLIKGHLLKLFGEHLILSITSILATFLVFLTPFSLSWSFVSFAILRFIQGFTCSNLLTIAGMIVNSWATLKERGLFIAVLSSHTELGALLTMGSSGLISSNFGWPTVFYIHTVVLGVLTFLWIFYYRNKPENHPIVGVNELETITKGKKHITITNDCKIPVARIFGSFVFWGLVLSIVSYYLVFQFTISFASIYLKNILGVSPSSAGFITLIPLLIALIIKFVSGYISDRLKINELLKIKLFNTVGLMGPAIFFIILSINKPGTSKILDIVLVCLPIAFLGFSSGGFPKCAVLIAGKFTPFLMTVFQFAVGLTCLGTSFLVPKITANDTFTEWSTVFAFYGLILSFSNTIFVISAQSEPAGWAISPIIEPIKNKQEA